MNGESSQPTMMLAGNTATSQNLPDGSKVFMNKNAEISYVESKGKRVVKLKGEAFFEVVHNETQPFVIEINGIVIKDIGTAFNVKALPGSNLIEVLVESGEVQFYSAKNDELSVNGLTLVKGEKAIYDKTTKLFNKVEITTTDNSMSYRSKIFHFKNTPLKEAITLLNDVYGSDIRLAEKDLGNCRLSVEFNNEDIEMLVFIIAETLDLQVERSSTSITLKGTSCPE
jgi:transmembrane sensor